MKIIEGIIETIIYRNNKNAYTVARLRTEEETITITGHLPFKSQGATVRLRGKTVVHKTYGEQFSVSKLLDAQATYTNNMEAYLMSGAVDRVGPATAKRIIDKFGDDTYDIFKNDPERLLEVKGIGPATYKKIITSFKSQADISDIMIELSNFGVDPSTSTRLFRKYGENVVELIKENPYRLASEGLRFKDVDSIALEIGVKKTDPSRISASGTYIINRAVGEGNTFLPMSDLVYRMAELLKLDIEEINKSLDTYPLGSELWMMNSHTGTRIYDGKLNSDENYIGMKLGQLKKIQRKKHSIDIDSRINTIESVNKMEFATNQKLAIHQAFDHKVLIITGGPGTGKTTTLNAILNISEELGLSYCLSAPTGRAAKKMSEATGKEAKTIHRLLEYGYGDNGLKFNKNEEDPLDESMIIIDEMSMVDTYLFADLLKAVRDDASIVLLGDSDQLPSVGPGNVLEDLILSEKFPVVELDHIFRQEEGSQIVYNAHRINNGKDPIINQKDSDFFFMNTNDQSETVDLIKILVSKRLPKFYGVDPLQDIQILAPMKKGQVGVENLNKELQESINPEKDGKQELNYRGKIFRDGDKVMQIKNNYELEWAAYTKDRVLFDKGVGVFNGDIGIITSIDLGEKSITVDFDGKEIEYFSDTLDELEHAYAITIHKSQGSEFPIVIIPMHFTPPILGNRNLIYTAITRGSQLVVLVGKQNRLTTMIQNTFTNERHTSLDERVCEMEDILQ